MTWNLLLLLLMPLGAILLLHFSSWGRTFPRPLAQVLAGLIWLLSLSFLLLPVIPLSWPALGLGLGHHQAVMLPFFTFLFFLLLLLCPASLRYHQEATMIFALEIGVIALFLAQDIFLYFLAFTLIAFPLFFELRNQGATAREIRFFLLFQTSKLVLFALAFLSLYIDFSPQGREAFFSLPALLAQIPQNKISFFTTLLFSLALLAQLGVFPFHLPTVLVFQKLRYSGVIAYLFGHLLVTSMLTLGSNFLLPIFRPFFELLIFLLLLNAIYFAVLSLTQQVLRRLVVYQYISFLSAGMTLLLSPSKVANQHLLHGTIELVMLSLVFGGMLCALWLAEYRLNISNITQYQGAAHRLPSLAAFFFLLVLTAIGFPGTIGYIAEELLLQNRFNHARIQGFASLLVIGLNAWVLFRCFSRIFLGAFPRHPHVDIALSVREHLALLCFFLLIIVNGFIPHLFFRFF